MDKEHLLGLYRTAFNRIQLAYASIVLWSYPDTPSFFVSLHEKMGPEVKIFPDVMRFVRDGEALRIACEELFNTAYRTALNDLLEQSKTYCHSTGQLELLKSQPWFPLWRVLRNCFAHNLYFNFSPEEKAMLPVTWSGVTITLEMNKKPPSHKTLPRAKLLELLKAAQTFIERDGA